MDGAVEFKRNIRVARRTLGTQRTPRLPRSTNLRRMPQGLLHSAIFVGASPIVFPQNGCQVTMLSPAVVFHDLAVFKCRLSTDSFSSESCLQLDDITEEFLSLHPSTASPICSRSRKQKLARMSKVRWRPERQHTCSAAEPRLHIRTFAKEKLHRTYPACNSPCHKGAAKLGDLREKRTRFFTKICKIIHLQECYPGRICNAA